MHAEDETILSGRYIYIYYIIIKDDESKKKFKKKCRSNDSVGGPVWFLGFWELVYYGERVSGGIRVHDRADVL